MPHQIIDSLRHRFICLLPLCLAALVTMPLAIQAQEISKPSAMAETAIAPEKQGGALFKIYRSDHGNDHVVYLFGTIHVGKPDFFPLAPVVMNALLQASNVAVEIDPTDQQMMRLVQKYALYPASQALTDDLSPALYQQITALLEKYHMSIDTSSPIWRMKPWMVATQLAMFDYASNGFKQENGVDNYLIAFAKTEHKPLISLERIHDQLSLLGDMSIQDQVKFLQDSVDILQDPIRANISLELTRLWRSGDLDAMEKLLQEMVNDGTFSGKFMQTALLDGRNPGMADALEKLLNTESSDDHQTSRNQVNPANNISFAGIGILHLVGPNSVQALLRHRGYTVRRID